jgi:hypothetical protein
MILSVVIFLRKMYHILVVTLGLWSEQISNRLLSSFCTIVTPLSFHISSFIKCVCGM